MLQCIFVSGLRMLSQNENSCLLNAFQYNTHGSSELLYHFLQFGRPLSPAEVVWTKSVPCPLSPAHVADTKMWFEKRVKMVIFKILTPECIFRRFEA